MFPLNLIHRPVGRVLQESLMFEEAAAPIAFKTADVAGLRVFYREAGDPSKPAIVLLHGFPSSL